MPDTRLSALIPRFLRLSALVAAELGSEAREEEDGSSERLLNNSREASTSSSSASHAQSGMYPDVLRPSREWYMLFAGLLTRAVLEGYVTAGWKGPEAVHCLLTVGVSVSDHIAGVASRLDGDGKTDDAGEDPFEELDPDELPRLVDAARMLFYSLNHGAPSREPGAESEFEVEMGHRLRKVSIRPLAHCLG